MSTIPLRPPIPAITPAETIRVFRLTYTLEEVQEELWRCLQPRLLASFSELDPDHTNQLASFYENIEILVSAVYQLPDLSAPPEAKAMVKAAAGGTCHA
ncbi:MAG: hypothetical protein LPK07_15675 [Hymenobacteraceae bacterium]|nr:hypothetical protein [Hymenobacteraceae bacterium]MDX5483118.1 hypothetical protein [Hymenobacteraceae bacterium]